MAMNPKLSIETATQLAVFLSNRPGTLARVCAALAEAGINIHALTISDTVDHSVVRMVVSDPTKALMLLGETGVLALENEVLMIDAFTALTATNSAPQRTAHAAASLKTQQYLDALWKAANS